MTFSSRRREEQFAERERAGEDLWAERFDERALRRLDALWELLEEADRSRQDYEVHAQISRRLRLLAGHPIGDYVGPGTFARAGSKDPAFAADLIESILWAYERSSAEITAHVNLILREHRLAYKVVDGSIVAWKEDELHAAVVEPALRLLIPSNFSAAHESYLKALREIGRGDAADAITDAGAALEEVLKALGCGGNSLGSRLVSAKKIGLLARHDSTLAAGVEKFLGWVGGDRSEMGDSHGVTGAVVADAWLMVHVVGALIVRLVDAGPSRAEED